MVRTIHLHYSSGQKWNQKHLGKYETNLGLPDPNICTLPDPDPNICTLPDPDPTMDFKRIITLVLSKYSMKCIIWKGQCHEIFSHYFFCSKDLTWPPYEQAKMVLLTFSFFEYTVFDCKVRRSRTRIGVDFADTRTTPTRNFRKYKIKVLFLLSLVLFYFFQSKII